MYQYICAMFCFKNSINMERNYNSLLRSFIIYLNLIIVVIMKAYFKTLRSNRIHYLHRGQYQCYSIHLILTDINGWYLKQTNKYCQGLEYQKQVVQVSRLLDIVRTSSVLYPSKEEEHEKRCQPSGLASSSQTGTSQPPSWLGLGPARHGIKVLKAAKATFTPRNIPITISTDAPKISEGGTGTSRRCTRSRPPLMNNKYSYRSRTHL